MQLTTDEIKDRIPHRSPFLWIDRVLELTDTRIVAEKELSPDLPVFQGHYPDFPILPGVLHCEAAFQASAVLISYLEPTTDGEVPVVTRLNETQFRRMVRPGETLSIEVTLEERVSKAFYLSGRVRVGDKLATRLKFVCTAAPAPE